MEYSTEFKELLKKNNVNEDIYRSTESFFDICQRYYWVYLIHNNIGEKSRRILENYVDPMLYKRKKTEDNNKIKLNIEEKMYVDLFSQIYNRNYKDKYTWESAIYDDEIIDRILETSGITENTRLYIHTQLKQQYENSAKMLDISQIHIAMADLKNALDTPAPTIEESILAVISKQKLDELYNCLLAGNVIGFYMYIAPIRRALYDGEYHKYTKTKGNTQTFFNITSSYNYLDYKNYIYSTIETDGCAGLLELLQIYEEAQKEINMILSNL